MSLSNKNIENINRDKQKLFKLENKKRHNKNIPNELVQDYSVYSSETEQDIIENTGIDFESMMEEEKKLQKHSKSRPKKFSVERKVISPQNKITSPLKYPIKTQNNQINTTKTEKNEVSAQHIKKDKKSPSETANELFKKAMKNTKTTPFELGNTQTTKISEILYEKVVNQNDKKSKHVDVLSKIKDEEILQDREAMRSKDDIKKITNMINRLEIFEKLKFQNLREKEKEVINKINQECIFNPNGISTTSRTPIDFYNEQLKFIEKKIIK